MTTQEKLEQLFLERILYIGNEIPESLVEDKRDKFILLGTPQDLVSEVQALIDSAKREVLEEMRPANATIESMRIYTPRTHTYMGKEYPACGICGFCPEAMNAFIDAQLEQSEESV